MNLAAVSNARQLCPDRPSWPAIFAKGFALLASEFPELRRGYCKFPYPHLFEWPATVANVAIEREIHGERAVLPFRIKNPAALPVAEMTRLIRVAATAPIDEVKDFRRALRLTGLPHLVRRVVWWFVLHVGRQRANYFGTFGVTAYPALGAESLHPLSPLTVTLTYGLVGDEGGVDVRLVYDHRVLDGGTVARAFVRFEQILNTSIRDEILESKSPRSLSMRGTVDGVPDPNAFRASE